MTDTVDTKWRSDPEAEICCRDAALGISIRQIANRRGLPFRSLRKDLPGGHRGLLLRERQLEAFVQWHSWHRHEGRFAASNLRSPTTFLKEKFVTNVERDIRQAVALKELRRTTLVMCVHQTKNETSVKRRRAVTVKLDRAANPHYGFG